MYFHDILCRHNAVLICVEWSLGIPRRRVDVPLTRNFKTGRADQSSPLNIQEARIDHHRFKSTHKKMINNLCPCRTFASCFWRNCTLRCVLCCSACPIMLLDQQAVISPQNCSAHRSCRFLIVTIIRNSGRYVYSLHHRLLFW
jgi:hypothetical protein